ncbi:DUF3027 domain-containing protein [Oerskovia sp. M15]
MLPFQADDPRLEAGYVPTGDEEQDEVAIEELALARVRVLSPQGRDEAAERWYRGTRGPRRRARSRRAPSAGRAVSWSRSRGARAALRGLRQPVVPDDGKVVSLDHGCGAHSETDVEPHPTDWPAADPLIDEMDVEIVQLLDDAQDATAQVSRPRRRLRRRSPTPAGTGRRAVPDRSAEASASIELALSRITLPEPGPRRADLRSRSLRTIRSHPFRTRTRTSGTVTEDAFATSALRRAVTEAWLASPTRFREDANTEEDHARGYYRDRVVVELAQNAADAAAHARVPGRLVLRLGPDAEGAWWLTAENSGAPLDVDGVASLASMRASAKVGPGRPRWDPRPGPDDGAPVRSRRTRARGQVRRGLRGGPVGRRRDLGPLDRGWRRLLAGAHARGPRGRGRSGPRARRSPIRPTRRPTASRPRSVNGATRCPCCACRSRQTE